LLVDFFKFPEGVKIVEKLGVIEEISGFLF
jgi:hypothetical protein